MEEESDKVEVPDLTLELDESMEPEQSAVEEEPKKMSEDQPAQEKQDVSGGINPIWWWIRKGCRRPMMRS